MCQVLTTRARRRARRGQNVAMVHVQDRLVQRDLRVLARQRLEGPPVRHRPALADEAGLGQRDRPQAQADDARAPGMRLIQQ